MWRVWAMINVCGRGADSGDTIPRIMPLPKQKDLKKIAFYLRWASWGTVSSCRGLFSTQNAGGKCGHSLLLVSGLWPIELGHYSIFFNVLRYGASQCTPREKISFIPGGSAILAAAHPSVLPHKGIETGLLGLFNHNNPPVWEPMHTVSTGLFHVLWYNQKPREMDF